MSKFIRNFAKSFSKELSLRYSDGIFSDKAAAVAAPFPKKQKRLYFVSQS